MKDAVSVISMKKSFRGNQVLTDVGFNIREGSIFALLGSNGAGKTTVVRILSTLLQPDGGSAFICGYDVVTQAESVRECISLTGQFAAVDEVLTGRENLTLIGELKRLKNVKDDVNRWLTFFDLEDAADEKVSAYSGGMRRKLDIAMSLMGSPRIIFLDEPTTGLDPQSRIAMWDLIRGLAQSGTTVFLTTQYLEEAESLADDIAVLHDGTIIAQGTPQNLRAMMPQRGASIHFETEKEAAEALRSLEKSGIAVTGVEADLPSLEDVFLTLVNEKENDDE